MRGWLNGYSWALKAYPRRYRSTRGEELLSTALDASDSTRRGYFRDIADIILHGMHQRLGIGADRFAGQALDLAALPGLMIGAALAIVMGVFGEWLPITTHAPLRLTVGPFWTDGPVVYGIWILSAAGALWRPKYQRLFAGLAAAATIGAAFVGKAFFAAPNLWQMGLLAAFTIPALVAPSTFGHHARSRIGPLAIGVLALVLLCWMRLTLTPPPFHWSPSFYWWGTWRIAQYVGYVGALALAVMCVLVVKQRLSLAGAVAVLVLPPLVVGASYPGSRNPHNDLALAEVVLVLALIVMANFIERRAPLGRRSVGLEKVDASPFGAAHVSDTVGGSTTEHL